MPKDLKSGVYLHYSGLIVFVLGIAKHSETEEKFVCYIALGVKHGPRITVRPYNMFFDKVTVKGVKKPRFKYIGQEMPKKLAKKYLPLSK